MYNKINQFEWDHQKAQKNQRKHGVTFEQAKSVFDDPYAIPWVDDEHADNEERFVMIGMAPVGLLFVSL